MNKSYKLILNRHLGVFQVAPETARSAGKGSGTIGTGARLRPLAHAVLLALLGSSPLAMAASGSCTLVGTGTLSGVCQGDSGMSAPGASGDPGGSGTAAATGSGYDYSSSATLVGGGGGQGGNSEAGIGSAGGAGGAGLSGAGRFINNASISGGAGGRGGNSSALPNSTPGNGGKGGTGVVASGLWLSNQSAIAGGNGGAGGDNINPLPSANSSGGNGGEAVAGNHFTLINDGSVVGGAGGSAGMGAMPGMGGIGGSGATAVSGDGFVVVNNGIVLGGAGGTSSPMMPIGSQGGSGISGSNFEVRNNTGATISSGASAPGGMFMGSGPAIQSSGGSTIYNAGTISNSSISGTAIMLSGGSNTLVLENGSNIQGLTFAGSADTFALGGSADSAFNLSELNTRYIGFGTFDKRDASTWTLSGDSTGTTLSRWNVKQGTLRTANGTTLTGSVNVQQGGTLQLGNTRINGALVNDGTLQLGHAASPRPYVYVDGSFSQSRNGVYRIAAESNDSEGGYSRLSASGNVTLAGNAAVDVAQANRLAIGQSLDNVVYTSAALSGNFAKVTDNSALFDFKSVATNGVGGHVDFQVVKATTIVDIIDGGTKPKPPTKPTPTPEDNQPSISGNKPARGAAQVLDTIIGQGTDNAGMQQVITSLGKLSTNQQVSDAVSQTLPLLVGSSQAAANASLTAIHDVVQARVSQGRGLSSGDEVLGDRELWVKTFGSWGDQNERNGVSGFEVNSQGIVFGADAAINPQSRVGLAFAYAKSDINGDSKAAPNSADMDMYQLIGYGSYDLDDATQLTYQLDYGQGRTEGKRKILFMGTEAKSRYDSQVVHAGVGLGHTLRLGQATELTPSVRADCTWVGDEGYRETGAGALNLDVDRRDSESLVLGADAELVHLFSERLSTSLKLGVGYDTIGERASLTSAYAGEPGLSFRTQGLDPSPWLGRGGVGVSYRVTDSTELSANYDAEYREDFLNQSASLKVRWAF